MDLDPELLKDVNELKKLNINHNISIKNRLLSILKDSEYVDKLHEQFVPRLKIIPNKRCGNWYVHNDYYTENDDESYFKSTDGHTNQWAFSNRRLNFHLLKHFAETDGLIIVDSTRVGKSIPDSLSKTIPIWISIINKLFFPHLPLKLETPSIVSQYEYDRISQLLPSFYESIKCRLDLDDIKLDKPIKAYWINNFSKIPSLEDNTFNYMLLTTLNSREDMRFKYIKGAGDDHELWGNGLTPRLFWNIGWNIENLLEMEDSEIENSLKLILDYNKTANKTEGGSIFAKIHNVTNEISFGKLVSSQFKQKLTDLDFDKVVVFSSQFEFDKCKENVNIFHYQLESNCKKSSKKLRFELSNIITSIDLQKGDKMLILCDTGDDLSVGLILALLSLNYDENWNFDGDVDVKKITKDKIRQNLIKLVKINNINPQRATLNSVNSFLMS